MADDGEKKHSHKEEHAHKQYMEHKEHKHHKKNETAAWTFGILALVFAILFVVALLTKGFSGGASTVQGGLSEDEVKAKTMTYLQSLPSLSGQTVSIDSIKEVGGIYSLKLNIGGQPFDSYATKDGGLLFPSAMNMNEKVNAQAAQPQQPTNVPKSDKPVVELFVMSHCPFGTQAEKGMLPAVRALGDKVDFKVKFVYYAMHGEKEVKEQLVQYCIQKDEPSKFLPYLACFLNDSAGQGNEAASNKCIADLGVDKTKLESCKTSADKEFKIMESFKDTSTWLSGRFPLFNTDKAANEKYGVGGSPTLVINGVQSNAGRDAVSYLKAICGAFNNEPSECQTQLSATPPGPGFGYDSVGAAQAAGCGV